MTDPRPIPALTLPPGVTEELLCEYVEGTLAPAEAARIQAALSGDPGLRTLIGGIASDRAALTRAPEPRPPADLLERVQARLEREALVGLSDGERAASPDVIVRLNPAAQTLDAGQIWSRLWRPLALAAGLALVVTGGVYWARIFAASSATPGGRNPIAQAPVDPAPAPATEAVDQTTTIAAAPAVERAIETLKTSRESTLAAVSEPVPEEPEIDPERAAELLRRGRLVIRVAGAPQAEASARAQALRGLDIARPAVFAGARSATPAADAPTPIIKPQPAWLPPRVDLASLLEFNRADTRSDRVLLGLDDTRDGLAEDLESLRARIERRVLPLGVSVRFEEAPEPVAPPLNAGELLWWSGPSSAWARRLSVPVEFSPR
jgi:hypothetical protein